MALSSSRPLWVGGGGLPRFLSAGTRTPAVAPGRAGGLAGRRRGVRGVDCSPALSAGTAAGRLPGPCGGIRMGAGLCPQPRGLLGTTEPEAARGDRLDPARLGQRLEPALFAAACPVPSPVTRAVAIRKGRRGPEEKSKSQGRWHSPLAQGGDQLAPCLANSGTQHHRLALLSVCFVCDGTWSSALISGLWDAPGFGVTACYLWFVVYLPGSDAPDPCQPSRREHPFLKQRGKPKIYVMLRRKETPRAVAVAGSLCAARSRSSSGRPFSGASRRNPCQSLSRVAQENPAPAERSACPPLLSKMLQVS